MAVLYRKYRPQTFAEVLNQKHVVRTLQNQVALGAPAHAYLFTGSRGVGKTSIARILAKAVNCIDPDAAQSKGDACGKCAVCKQIEAGSFLDIVEIDAASNTGVDNIRELIEHVKFAPVVGKYKVFIIDEVHMLSKGAFAALLKTLEEPPKHAIFILATTEINKVPATIISRTQKFDFKAISAQDLLEHLEKVAGLEGLKIDREVLQLVSQAAEGSVRDALSLLDKLMTLGDSLTLAEGQQLLGVTDAAVCQKLLELIVNGQASELPQFFGQLTENGADFKIFNRDFLEYLRKALVFKISGDISGLSEERRKSLEELSQKFAAVDLVFITRLFLRSYKELEFAPDPATPTLLASLEAALHKNNAGPAPAKSVAAAKPVEQPQVSSSMQKPEMQQEQVGQIDMVPVALEVLQADDQSAIIITFEQVRDAWPKIIGIIKDINNPLSSLLKTSELMELEENKVVLGVKFLFNKQSLESMKNQSVFADAAHSVLGKKMGIKVRVLKSGNGETAGAAEVLNQALQVFGGELVE